MFFSSTLMNALPPVRRCRLLAAWGCVPSLLVCLLMAGGCATKEVGPSSTPPPGATYTGESWLYGTVGSLASLRGRDALPLPVSGYSLVVDLDGTGSSEVPEVLRDQLINEMRRRGMGRMTVGMDSLPPEVALADPRTAVVAVEGLIPPGAVKGTRFDVLVSAADTQTTSLAGGTLYTTELSLGGANPAVGYSRTQARARGSLYLDPFDADGGERRSAEFARQAMVVGGGVVMESRPLELLLNVPSWSRARAVESRINERFPRSPGEREDTASALSPRVVRVNVPARFAQSPERLLELIAHLYIQKGPEFAPIQARRLGERLVEDPSRAEGVRLTWEALGKNALPAIRELYAYRDLDVALTALRAGAYLEDEQAAGPLMRLTTHTNPQVRRRVAQAMVYLVQDPGARRGLMALLDDEDRSVRIAAYEALAVRDSPLLDRLDVPDVEGEIKVRIDRVPSQRPLVYITQERVPRVAIFGPQLGLRSPLLATMWDSRLVLRSVEQYDALQKRQEHYLVAVYQPAGRSETQQIKSRPTVATLAYLLAHRPSREEPQPGLDLPYSDVVDALYHLCREGDIPAPVEVNQSPLARLVAARNGAGGLRTSPRDDPAGTRGRGHGRGGGGGGGRCAGGA